MPRKIKKYGWIPDLPDHRDHLYAAPMAQIGPLPTSVDLCTASPSYLPAVYDQGQLGSCTGNAIAAAIQFDRKKQGLPDFTPSRLFIYYNERDMEGTVDTDSGAMIRDGIKSVADKGACREDGDPGADQWPYDITKFSVKPPDACYTAAALDRAVSYQSVTQDQTQMKGCLADGYPFVFGFTVYDSFESPAVANNGQAPLPGPNDQVVGGHAVMAVGYDDTQQRFIVRNSWGPGWGMKDPPHLGYFTLPYTYLLDPNLSSDFWTIRLIQVS